MSKWRSRTHSHSKSKCASASGSTSVSKTNADVSKFSTDYEIENQYQCRCPTTGINVNGNFLEKCPFNLFKFNSANSEIADPDSLTNITNTVSKNITLYYGTCTAQKILSVFSIVSVNVELIIGYLRQVRSKRSVVWKYFQRKKKWWKARCCRL
jgi:hypothetical protein